ncbi:HisA/HisF-related TIM barrel protein [Phocaeicola vulgatus]|nr:HisA/HisF-related TIM barrel protein [Phocaeicola vulgatus]
MIELIPAIDIIDGKCVRLSQGDYNTQKVYNENPVEVAKKFEAHGIHRLHIVDPGWSSFTPCCELPCTGPNRQPHFSGH